MIRQYRTEDRDAVLGVWSASAKGAHPFWPADRLAQERAAVAERFLPVAETFVFERGGSVVGFISLLGEEVGGLFVAPQSQRAGIGRALIDHAMASRPRLELDVYEANAGGRAFYERCGFAVVGGHIEERSGLRLLRLRRRQVHQHDRRRRRR